MTRFEVTVLGRTHVTADGRPAALRPREAGVAAALALTGGTTAVDDLVDLLWPDPPASAVKSLHNHVARLRRAADVVVTEPGGYRLAPDVAVDRDRFEALVARTDPEPGRADALAGLLDAWQGPAYGVLDGHPSVELERARLAELRLRAEEQVVALRLLAGAEPAIAAAAEELAETEPYREHRWWLLMLARHRAGRRRDALAAYQQARAALIDGAGIEPGAALRTLEAQVLADDPALATAAPLLGPHGPFEAVPPTAPAGGRRPRAARLVGRAAELDRLSDHATAPDAGPLVVVGDAGTGKTALGDAVAGLLEARGVVVLRTSGEPTPEGALRPVERLVEQLVTAHGADAVADWTSDDDRPAIARLVPALATATTGVVLPGPVDAAVGRLLTAAADRRPHLVLVDDAHLVPPSSARALAAAPAAAGVPLVLLARPEPLPVPFAELDAPVLRLAGLDHRAVADLLASVAGHPVGEDVVEHLRRRSGGNPLLLGEIVATPAVRASLEAGDGVAQVAAAEEVSDTVAAFAQQRLAELAAPT
ncbi:MAG: AAA family ATPase, partial [Acidimicrobiales bacterium]|nr:AAA family ATPase [Acidimicrobiales bacterium]